MLAVGVMRPKHLITVLAGMILITCDSGTGLVRTSDKAPLKPLDDFKADLAFTCVHEAIPAPSADTDVVFKYAHWLQKNNLYKQDKTVDAEIKRLYRIAAENGHFMANINLQNGKFALRNAEHLRLSQQLIDANVATGYYFIGRFLKHGSAGLEWDQNMALRYFRKAADMGSADAQYYVGDKLYYINIAPKIVAAMYRCAAEQGNSEASVALGVHLKDERHEHEEVLEAFQLGIAAGSSTSASLMYEVFSNPSSNALPYLGQQEDLERADRYKKIGRILTRNFYADPTVPEINEIVPLPPAKLPAWDGKLQSVEVWLANVPPPKPTPQLIQQLAKTKTLDPATGEPMPSSSSHSEN